MLERKERNKRIHERHKTKGTSFRQLASEYNITPTRVQQVYWDIENPKKLCNTHQKMYRGKCQACRISKEYPGLLTNLGSILKEVEEVKRIKSRDAITVQKRKLLIKRLKDDYKLSYVQIGFMMSLDRTTIMYHYAN